MATRIWKRNSTNILAHRLLLAPANATQETGATVSATVSRAGTTIFSARPMSYDPTARLDHNDASVGAYTCKVSAAEASVEGVYTAVITATKSSDTLETTVTIQCVADDGSG